MLLEPLLDSTTFWTKHLASSLVQPWCLLTADADIPSKNKRWGGSWNPYLSDQLLLSTSCNCLNGMWSCRGRTSVQRLGKVKGRVPSAWLCMKKSYVWGSAPPCWGRLSMQLLWRSPKSPHTCSVSKPSTLVDFPRRPLAKLNFAFSLGPKWRGDRDCKSFPRKKFSKPPPIRPHLRQVPSLPNTL